MSLYSVADAKNRLSELIDRVVKGEGVIITRHGKPVVELKRVPKEPGPVTDADIAWLDKHRVGKKAQTDAGTVVSAMRDDEER